MWDIEPAKLVLIFLRQNLLYILANFWDVLPHQPVFSWAIWKVSTTHGKLRTSAWWSANWLNEILQKQLRYDFSNIAHLYFWNCLEGVLSRNRENKLWVCSAFYLNSSYQFCSIIVAQFQLKSLQILRQGGWLGRWSEIIAKWMICTDWKGNLKTE